MDSSYLPDANYHGGDTFAYRAFDGEDWSAPVWTHITVTPVNDAPIANDDQLQLIGESSLEFAVAELLANDTDIEGDAITPQLVRGPDHGTLTLDPKGFLKYVPDEGFVGVDRILYGSTTARRTPTSPRSTC